MAKRSGVLLMGAAVLSILFPRRRPAAVAAPPEARPARPTPKRLWALVQVRPQVQVLAVSHSREDLEAELAELNETWNHCDLRVQRQTFEVQATCVLQTDRDDRLFSARDPVTGP